MRLRTTGAAIVSSAQSLAVVNDAELRCCRLSLLADLEAMPMPTPAMMATMAVEMRASLSLVKSIVVYWMGGVSGEAVWMGGGVWCGCCFVVL